MRAPEAESEPAGRTQTWAQNQGADRNGGSCAFNFGLSLGSSTELNPSTQPTPRPTFTGKWEPGTQGSHCSPRWRTSDLAKRASCFPSMDLPDRPQGCARISIDDTGILLQPWAEERWGVGLRPQNSPPTSSQAPIRQDLRYAFRSGQGHT